MRDLPQRTITALIYGAIFLVSGLVAGPWFTLVLGILLLLGMQELWRLASALPPAGARVGAMLGGVIVLAGGLFALLYLTSYVQGHGELIAPDARVWPWLRINVYPWIFMALLPTWAADIAAFVVGSLIGRRKLAPRISPGKTWEGTLAGFVAAAIAVWFVGTQVFSPSLPTEILVVLGLVIGPAGLCGDLLESALKRAAGVKDSGTIFPGHGGVLDRIDSLLLVAPVVALALNAYRSGMMEL
ncbi:MAG TPA: phosphatidate cytidylyltransferase [Verrucomicrobiae bacterium]|nr:phosphatidate cytidylyltransferase [Verrucomicrobiae bacterium]